MDVLGREGGGLERLGPLPAFVESTADLPVVRGPAAVSNLDGRRTEKLDLSIGLKLLMDFLSGMATVAGLPSLKAQFARVRSVQFTFTNVQSHAVDQVAVGSFLAAGRLRDNPINDTYFLNEDSEEFVIFEVLKTDTLTLMARDEKSVSVGLDIPALQSAVGVAVEVRQGASGEAAVSFRGPQFVTFGFKCFRLEFAGGRWRFSGAKASGGLAFAVGPAAAGEDEEPLLLGRGVRLALKA